MKRITGLLAVLIIATGIVACQQKQEEKSSISYTNPVQSLPPQMNVPDQTEQLRKAAEKSPKSVGLWIDLGNALMDSRRPGEAVEAYGKALALDPKNVNVLVDQGTCYRRIGKFDKAVEQYRKAIRINPKFPTVHRNLGVVLSYDLHKTKEGVREFKKYIELAPNAPDAGTIRQTIQELSGGK